MELLPAFVGSPQPNKVYNCDALTLLRAITSSSVDIVVTSPPYNLLNSSGGGMKRNNKGLWNKRANWNWYTDFSDDLPHDVYVAQQRSVLDECMRILKPTGAIFYNHKWRVQSGLLQDRADIMEGFPVRQIIIWDRGNGFNFNEGYLLPMYEVIYMIAKPDFKLVKGANVWGDVWRIPPAENKSHPNSFPIELPRRCIEISGAQLVVDPYGGAGTSARAAKLMGVDWLTCDISPEYCRIANWEIDRRADVDVSDLPLFAQPA